MATIQDINAELARREIARRGGSVAEQPRKKPVSDLDKFGAVPEAQPVEKPTGSIDELREPLATLVTGAVAEPLAGLAGLVSLPFTDLSQSVRNIDAVREALTVVPKTPEGMKALQEVAEVLQPVTETLQSVEESAGDIGAGLAGPVGGAIGKTLPTAALMAAAPILKPIATALKNRTSATILTSSAKKLLQEAVPTIDGLKSAARSVYNDIGNLGVTLNSGSVARLSTQLQSLARKSGFDKGIHPKVNAALNRFGEITNTPQSLSEIDILRRVAQSAAKSIEPDEARIGTLLVNRIDDFLDNVGKKDLSTNKVGVEAKDIGAKYKDARQLWRRVKKAEIIEDAFNKAGLQATGFENGIRVQFRQILSNKKKSRGFAQEELDAMRQVVKGGSVQNIAKMIGRFGFSEGQASNMLMGSLGVAGGAAVGGAAGAVAVPLIGQLSRGLAQKMTRNSAAGADLIVRAGKDGLDIVKAYIKTTKPAERTAQELSELLLRPDIAIGKLRSTKSLPAKHRTLIADAVFLVSAIKSQQEQQ